MTYTLTGMSSLGTVTKESSSKDAGLFFQPLPMSDSSDAIMLDLFGSTRTFTISGVFTTGNGFIPTFISQLDGLVNGSQDTKVFHSDKSNANYNVLVSRVSWESEEGGVNLVTYTIELQEGSS